jgi:oxalate decarboxylase/phosphoglucose isomerase-like protein (cupin superfamily)
MAAYEKAHIDEIASKKWPHWIPIRHHFAIETFGMNAYRRNAGEGVVPEHDEADSREPELYYVASGHAVFTVAGEEVDAPAGTCVWVSDPAATRSAEARTDDTLVVAVGAAPPGEVYRPDGWDSQYLEGDG